MSLNFNQYLILIFALLITTYKAKADPIINEILASNLNYISDNYGDYDDLIEIYNPTNSEINLSGYYISDSYDNLTKWIFPLNNSQFILPPDGYIKLWADGEIDEGPDHLSFSLNKNGESVILTSPDGSTIIDHKDFDYQMTNVSYGRDSQNNDNWIYFINPTIGYENNSGLNGILKPPFILPDGGYYSQPISVFLTNTNSTGEIYYTLNSELPNENDLQYENQILLDNSYVINARSFKNNFIPSHSNSQLYIMNMNEPYSLPIFTILTDPNNLWSDSLGIYTNYLEEGVKWEKRCINQFFSNNSLLFTLPSGIRIQGRSSRVRPKKSFRLFFKNTYDNDRLNYPLFGNLGPTSFKNIVLRSGYDDDIQMSTGTLIRDPLVSSMWEKLGMLTSRGVFSNLFINDQYWGIYNLRESVNEHFIADKTGYINFDLIRYVKYNFDLKYGKLDDWNSFNTYIKNTDFSETQNYEEVLNKIDIENFLNLQALIICTSYWSWGWGVSAFKQHDSGDKWKWTIWDMDRAFTIEDWNGFTFLNDTTGLESPNIIAFQLLKNNQFKYEYINRISDFYNSLFKPENVIEQIDSIKNIIANDIYFETERWDSDTLTWQDNIQSIKTYAINRQNVVKQQLTNYFSLQEEGEIILESTAGGYIKLNSISINNFPWSGHYFKNIPIHIEAIPNPGYIFKEWEFEQIYQNPITISLASNSTYLSAIFVPENTNNDIDIITPSTNANDNFHPIIFKYYYQDNLRMNNEPIIGDLHVNDLIIDSVVVIKKGVGIYLLNLENLSYPIALKVEINNKISDEIILNQLFPETIDTLSGIISQGQTVWEANSNKFINDDLIINGNLTIREGANISLNEHTNIFVNGSLNILGDDKNTVIFKSKDWNKPWGGIEFYNSLSSINNCFFINGGADPTKGWAHTNTQPILFAKENSNINIKNSYILYSSGKALGSLNSEMQIDSTIISFVFMGGEFLSTYLNFNHSYVLNIPNDNGIFVDADNDGFHIDHRHPSINKPSKIRNSFFITGKDDAIDHAGSRIDIENCWIEGWLNEGVAASTSDTVYIRNTISKNNQNGFEAGYGSPIVIIDHCLVIENSNGFRLGDNYSTPNNGKMIITNSIAYNNTDNIKNYTNHLQGPLPNGIEISFSITNDEEYNQIETNIVGEPVFNDSTLKIHFNSIGSGMGTGGKSMGIIDSNVLKYGPLVVNEIMYNSSSYYDSEDWIELYNPSNDSINISLWSIKDRNNDNHFIFPESLIIPGNDFLVVSRNVNAFHSIHSHEPAIIGDIPFGFGRGDQVRLYSSIMMLVDSVQYEINSPWPSSPDYSGHSLELNDLNDNLIPGNWSASTNIIGTPGCNNNNNICLNITQEVIPLPDRIKIFQNYPNPFNPITNIHYSLPQDSFVSLNIYNFMGQKVKTIVNHFQNAGEKYVTWNSTNDNNKNVSSGIYFYTLKSGNFFKTKKMMLIK